MTTAPPPAAELSADEARRIALRAQGFLGAPDRRGGVRGVLRHLGAVQLDTISVLARSHELIPYARLGAVGRTAVEDGVLDRAATPSSTGRTRPACCRSRSGRTSPSAAAPTAPARTGTTTCRRARTTRWSTQLRAEGPLTATELGGAKNGGQWWDWSAAKVAVERALMYGEVVCTERRGWKRVYDLAERAVPDALLHDDLDDAECLRRLVRAGGPVARASAPGRTSRTTTGSRASRSTRWSRTPGWCR